MGSYIQVLNRKESQCSLNFEYSNVKATISIFD